MPWLPGERKPFPKDPGTYNMPAGRLEAAVEDGKRIVASRTRNRQGQLRQVIDAVHVATRDSLNDLINAERSGFEMPATAALVEDHAKALPASARQELRDFLEEVRPVIAAGDRGKPREAGRRFTWTIAERLVDDEGWAPKRRDVDAPGETPDALAALIPRD